MASSQNDLNELLLKQLECPVCMETCTPPIRMCVRSHIVCSECATGLTECATCRQPMAAERSWFAEDLCSKVKFPCKHVNNGCHDTFDLSKLNAHLPVCTFKSYDCLIDGQFVNGAWESKCSWKGPGVKLLEHVEKAHTTDAWLKGSRLSRTVAKEYSTQYHHIPCIVLMSAYGSLFWKISRFWPVSKEVEFIVICVGTSNTSSKYGYKIEVGHDLGGELSYHSRSVPCSFEESEGKTLKVGDVFRKCLNRPDGELPYVLTILEGK